MRRLTRLQRAILGMLEVEPTTPTVIISRVGQYRAAEVRDAVSDLVYYGDVSWDWDHVLTPVTDEQRHNWRLAGSD